MAEHVVLHDMVAYSDPDPEYQPVPGQPRTSLYAPRGAVLGGDEYPAPREREIDRLLKLGAITADKDSLNAKLALAGQKADTGVVSPYINLSNPAEAVRAAQAAGRATGNAPSASSSPQLLAQLSLSDLKVLAVAYGRPELVDSDSVSELVAAISGQDDAATPLDETRENEQLRDQRQIAAREVSNEAGQLGTDVLASGVQASTGEKLEPTERRSRRRSAAQQSDSSDQ